MTLIDLSHVIDPNVPRFPGIPAPQIGALWTHAESAGSGRYEGCTCEVTTISFATSLGTYLDAPYHFDPQGLDISQLPLQRCILRAVCLDARRAGPSACLDPALLAGQDLAGRAVLLCTGWSRYWGRERYHTPPFIGRDLAVALRDRGAALVGVDTINVDNPRDPRRPAHLTLLRAGIPIVENLTGLEALVGRTCTFYAVPPAIAGAAAFPVRAFAQVEG